MKKSTRSLTVVAALALVAAAGCSSKAARDADNASSEGPIKVGLVAITSGPLAEIGESHVRGAKLAIEHINADGGIDGRKVELVVKDEKGDPNASVQVARELMSDGVKLIAGYTLDPDCLAASPIITKGGGLLVGLSCQGDSLTQKDLTDNYFQLAPSNTMLSRATAKVAADSGLTAWQGIGPDYEFGREVWSNFAGALGKSKTGKDVYVPLDATQVAPYINSLLSDLPKDSAKSTGLFMSTFSATTIGLAKQGASYDFFGRYGEVLNLGGSTPTAEALGADTPPMTFVYDYFDEAYDNEINTRFVDGYRKAYDKRPNAWSYEGYAAMLAIKAGVEKADSADAEKVAKAMVGMSFDGPKGTLEFRASDHLLMSPVTAWKVKGDKSAAEGFVVVESRAIPAKEVAPKAD